ncbi:hypothetical protein EYF80_063567 [Liparis tanakae]|uniref:Uncharacterized protein n=1 Tax=Liparis tanakae TaxID=230148 RepID=A0A4Z2EBN5_9TELE|nr:hypothetical protein EYF80_063567 [Liparis tanakae]
MGMTPEFRSVCEAFMEALACSTLEPPPSPATLLSPLPSSSPCDRSRGKQPAHRSSSLE